MTYRLEICCSIQLSYGTLQFFAVQRCKNLLEKSIFNAAKTFAIFKREKNQESIGMDYWHLHGIIRGCLPFFLFRPGAPDIPGQEDSTGSSV